MRDVAGLLEPVHRLAHLADRAALERERGDVDDRLVAVVERVQPVRRVQRQAALGRAEDRDAPVARVRVLDEPADQLVEALARPDRVARDDRDAADDAVGEERRFVLGEEVRLVGAQHERRERVDAPRLHERARELRARALPARRGDATVRASRRPPTWSARRRAAAATAGTSRRTRRRGAASRARRARAGRRASRDRTKCSVNGWSASCG